MSDKELLELAAKAAGLGDGPYDFSPETGWNPLADDGDLARLESALPLIVMWFSDRVEVAQYEHKALCVERFSTFGGDKHAARKRASVRCAAEIGRSKV